MHLEWLDHGHERADDGAIANAKTVVAKATRLDLLRRPDALVVDANLFEGVEVVERDSLVAPDHDDLADFMWLHPADVDVPKDALEGLAEQTLYDAAIVYNPRTVLSGEEILPVFEAAW